MLLIQSNIQGAARSILEDWRGHARSDSEEVGAAYNFGTVASTSNHTAWLLVLRPHSSAAAAAARPVWILSMSASLVPITWRMHACVHVFLPHVRHITFALAYCPFAGTMCLW
jgi:hypothetical protein